METRKIILDGTPVTVYFFSAIVAGSGAAGFNAADTLLREGVTDIALVTEAVKGGTSRNAGSDKQTYYKLSLAGGDGDSVRALGETLFSGGAMDGDIALCEAASSVSCFEKLALLGVPFPKNRWGEYVGYKTDHDPARRAASAGPYTSKLMTESLEKSAMAGGLRVFGKMQVIKVLVEKGKTLGLLCLNLACPGDAENRFAVFWSPSVILATGGPAAMYAATVYPESQHGAAGAAFEAGALARNLTEWQHGLASIRPRWNVSGSYMQALPRFVSTGENGGDEREFLADYFARPSEMLSSIFLKGYQWPFDVRKLNGSSFIDILVFLESRKGRRVFLDYTRNPLDAEPNYSALSNECREYLAAAGACFGKPIDRLERINKPAAGFYRERGVNLDSQMLEIALCVQHNNGGLAVDLWQRTNIEGLFAAGEAAGTHGVYRPGGSALNAGQTGSYRAAFYIAKRRRAAPDSRELLEEILEKTIARETSLIRSISSVSNVSGGERGESPALLLEEAQNRMTLSAGAFRNAERIDEAISAVKDALDRFTSLVRIQSAEELPLVYRLRDTLIAQYVYLSAMADYIRNKGKSRGSALYYHPKGDKPHPLLPEDFACLIDHDEPAGMTQETIYNEGECVSSWRPVNRIPQEDGFFETVWRSYRENWNIE